jgi:hypothetical protein
VGSGDEEQKAGRLSSERLVLQMIKAHPTAALQDLFGESSGRN